MFLFGIDEKRKIEKQNKRLPRITASSSPKTIPVLTPSPKTKKQAKTTMQWKPHLTISAELRFHHCPNSTFNRTVQPYTSTHAKPKKSNFLITCTNSVRFLSVVLATSVLVEASFDARIITTCTHVINLEKKINIQTNTNTFQQHRIMITYSKTLASFPAIYTLTRKK